MFIVCLLLMLIAIRLGKADINKREPPAWYGFTIE